MVFDYRLQLSFILILYNSIQKEGRIILDLHKHFELLNDIYYIDTDNWGLKVPSPY